MSKQWALGIALIVLLVALPLISIGTMRDQPALWWAGIVLLVVGGLIPPAARYLLDREEDEGEDEGGEEDEREDGAEGRERQGEEESEEEAGGDRGRGEGDRA